MTETIKTKLMTIIQVFEETTYETAKACGYKIVKYVEYLRKFKYLLDQLQL